MKSGNEERWEWVKQGENQILSARRKDLVEQIGSYLSDYKD